MNLGNVAERVAEGRLVSLTFLSGRGRVENELPDHPCSDARAKGDRFAFLRAFAGCAHAVDVARTEEIGDELFLHGTAGDMKVRVRVSPVWLDEQREILAAWRRERDPDAVGRELARALA